MATKYPYQHCSLDFVGLNVNNVLGNIEKQANTISLVEQMYWIFFEVIKNPFNIRVYKSLQCGSL